MMHGQKNVKLYTSKFKVKLPQYFFPNWALTAAPNSNNKEINETKPKSKPRKNILRIIPVQDLYVILCRKIVNFNVGGIQINRFQANL